MKIRTTYYEAASSEHTDETLALVKDFLDENKEFNRIIVATTTGATGAKTAEEFPEHHVVVVTHQAGFVKPNHFELQDEFKQRILNSGADLLTATHAFAGVSRGIRKAVGTWTATELMAVAFRTFSQGTKVCAEIAMMAADAGLAEVDKDVICIGGTGRGADTAWIVRPVNSSDFPNLKLKACLCKPLNF